MISPRTIRSAARHPHRRAAERRATRPRAMIGVAALALMILLAATSLAIFVTLTGTMNSTRESRDFVRALKNVDVAEADALLALNDDPTLTTRSGTGGAEAEGDASVGSRPDTWEWTKTTNPEFGIIAGGNLRAAGTFGNTDQDRDRAWRYRLIGSRSGSTDAPVYGIADVSAWTGVASSVDDSWIQGYVDGDWHLYGDGILDARHGSDVRRVIAFDDRSLPTTGVAPRESQRSGLTATLDEHLVNERVTACGDDLKRYQSSTAVPRGVLYAGDVSCYYSIVIDEPTQVVGTGAATVVSYGTVDIRSTITVQSGINSLRIYTSSGTVKFRGGPTIEAFIFAPNALCKTWDAQTVKLTGSLACRQIQMTANLYQPTQLPAIEPAGTAGDGIPDHSVSYLEFPGYRDRFGD